MIALPDVLNTEQLNQVRTYLERTEFISGAVTASGTTQQVKNNRELGEEAPDRQLIDQVIMSALAKHPLLSAWAQPTHLSAPLINKHGEGMEFGWHVDSPVGGQGSKMIRRDVALTLFLSDPNSYEGGALEVESPAGPKPVKLPAGSAFAYHCHALHRVTPVTSGVRFGAVVWLQSLIPDDDIRQMLFNLTAAAAGIEEREGKTDELLLINKVHQNLTRRFARP